MSRRGKLHLDFVSSDDGTRCAAECPHQDQAMCGAFGQREWGLDDWGRHPACIAAEQAAASVPSCDLRDDIDTVFWRYNADTPAQLAAFNRLVAAALRSESTGHLDGGARSLDASEALREARVQGMREGFRIVELRADQPGEHGYESDPGVAWEDASMDLDAAIEAVRKGER